MEILIWNKKVFNFFIILLMFLVSLNVSFSYYDDSNHCFVYFTNKLNPNINITINPGKYLGNINYADLFLINSSGDKVKIKNFPQSYFINQQLPLVLNHLKTYNFTFNVNLVPNKNNYFFLFNVTDKNGDLIRNTLGLLFGDTEFFIEYSNESFVILDIEGAKENNVNTKFVNIGNGKNNIKFVFNHLIKEYKIITTDENGSILENYTIINNKELLSYYKNYFLINFSNDIYNTVEFFTLTVDAIDIYGNHFEKTFSIYKQSVPFQVSLYSKKENISLPYYFNKELLNYQKFFNGTIYSSSKNFYLYVKTNRPASNCYFTNSLTGFTNYNALIDMPITKTMEEVGRSGNLFKVKVSTDTTNVFEIFCLSQITGDVSYLSDYLGIGHKLIKLSYYNKSFNFLSFSPTKLVSQTPFPYYFKLSDLGICKESYDNKNIKFIKSKDFITYNGTQKTYNGTHILKVNCVNRIGTNISHVETLNVSFVILNDIINYYPKYTASPNINVTVLLSEQAECKYSSKEILPSDYNTIPDSNKLQNEGGTKYSFQISVNNDGVNTVFVYCNKNNLVTKNVLAFYYDKYGPRPIKAVFLNSNGIESNYTNKLKDYRIKYYFNVSKYFSIDRYILSLYNSTSFITNLTTSAENYVIPYKDVTKIGITAFDKYTNKSGNLNFIPLFDQIPPSVDFTFSNMLLDITCQDSLSGCSKVYYGISTSPTHCSATTLYTNETMLNLNDNITNYICILAYDRAGNSAYKTGVLTGNSIINPNNNTLNNISNVSNPFIPSPGVKNRSNNETSNNLTYWNNSYVPPENTTNLPPPNQGSNSYWILIALALLFATAGGSGYYAYKKGYLDDYLDRLGINLPSTTNKKFKYKTNLDGRNAYNNINEPGKLETHIKKVKHFIDMIHRIIN